jgi:hypothetical protein
MRTLKPTGLDPYIDRLKNIPVDGEPPTPVATSVDRLAEATVRREEGATP